jgi:ubiquinone/menaquinone biosynthesis C-methylase UbiE
MNLTNLKLSELLNQRDVIKEMFRNSRKNGIEVVTADLQVDKAFASLRKYDYSFHLIFPLLGAPKLRAKSKRTGNSITTRYT